MKTNSKKSLNKDLDFKLEHTKIVHSNEKFLEIKQEWVKPGDFFEKLTIYDLNYHTLPNLDSLGSTTLIKK